MPIITCIFLSSVVSFVSSVVFYRIHINKITENISSENKNFLNDVEGVVINVVKGYYSDRRQ